MRPGRQHTLWTLWSEHKLRVLALGPRAYRHLAGLAGRRPAPAHRLAFLAWLAAQRDAPATDPAEAWLTAYGLVKAGLAPAARLRLVEAVATRDGRIRDLLFDAALEQGEAHLLASRIFRPAEAGFWKILHPDGSLTAMFGALELTVTAGELAARLAAAAGEDAAGLPAVRRILHALAATDVDAATVATLPDPLRRCLRDHLAVVERRDGWRGHPWFPWAAALAALAPDAPPPPRVQVTPGHAALLALERAWDADPAAIPALPAADLWQAALPPDLPGVAADAAAAGRAIATLVTVFAQAAADHEGHDELADPLPPDLAPPPPEPDPDDPGDDERPDPGPPP